MVKRKSLGRPTKDEAAAIDVRVLDAARLLFSQKGIANSSIDELAGTLGVSKHTIYRRYASKAQLLNAVVERDINAFRNELSSAGAKTTDKLESLHEVALRYFKFGSSRDYSAFYLLVSAEAVVSPDLRERLAEWTKSALQPLLNAVSLAQSAGHLRSGSVTSICEILIDLLEGANNRVRMRDATPISSHAARKLFDDRWDVFVKAMASE
ncbi:HTH-type transcriptional regulator AcrR [Allorhodopirellula heiligendammensis]|uniref:HTH-type transcriptional regulator AcrR n=2 Tax=Allorhodopirellula heiligendammensis TaxID=2714739 RepID=A0A5C6BCL9_9BACT|nr:HTH-type transcriptional regulator AcrR [Allorhodopirellula heiligendammensis]